MKDGLQALTPKPYNVPLFFLGVRAVRFVGRVWGGVGWGGGRSGSECGTLNRVFRFVGRGWGGVCCVGQFQLHPHLSSSCCQSVLSLPFPLFVVRCARVLGTRLVFQSGQCDTHA